MATILQNGATRKVSLICYVKELGDFEAPASLGTLRKRLEWGKNYKTMAEIYETSEQRKLH